MAETARFAKWRAPSGVSPSVNLRLRMRAKSSAASSDEVSTVMSHKAFQQTDSAVQESRRTAHALRAASVSSSKRSRAYVSSPAFTSTAPKETLPGRRGHFESRESLSAEDQLADRSGGQLDERAPSCTTPKRISVRERTCDGSVKSSVRSYAIEWSKRDRVSASIRGRSLRMSGP